MSSIAAVPGIALQPPSLEVLTQMATDFSSDTEKVHEMAIVALQQVKNLFALLREEDFDQSKLDPLSHQPTDKPDHLALSKIQDLATLPPEALVNAAKYTESVLYFIKQPSKECSLWVNTSLLTSRNYAHQIDSLHLVQRMQTYHYLEY